MFLQSFKQVCVQLPTSAVNVTLLVFAAGCRAAARCCGAAVAERPAAAVADRYLLLARRAAANPPRTAMAASDGTDRWTERRTGL